MPSIVFDDVSFSYENNGERFLALDHVSLEVPDGEFLCLVGHSGCGKSTMISLLAGLEQPQEGRILIDGKPVLGPAPDRSIVFQNYSLFPWQTALKNVEFAIRQTDKGTSRDEARKRALGLLEQVGVADAANRYPYQLSGGMRQRVAIARALGVDAPIMLLDEPFGALDPISRHKLQQLLLDLWAGSCCKTAVFVTHDIDEALVLADRIAFMEPRRLVKVFELTKDRSCDVDERTADTRVEAVKKEVLRLFAETATDSEDER